MFCVQCVHVQHINLCGFHLWYINFQKSGEGGSPRAALYMYTMASQILRASVGSHLYAVTVSTSKLLRVRTLTFGELLLVVYGGDFMDAKFV